MKSDRYTAACLTVFALVCAHAAITEAQASSSQPATQQSVSDDWPKTLAAGVDPSGKHGVFVLTLHQLRQPDDRGMLRSYQQHPNGMPFPNAVYVLSEIPAAGGEARQRWFYYTYINPTPPVSILSADLAWHSATGDLYIVISETKSVHGWLTIFKVPPDAEVAGDPRQWDPEKFVEWPGWPQPLARIEGLYRDGECGVKGLSVISEQDRLLICTRREDKHCPPALFGFSLKTRQWSGAELKGAEMGIKISEVPGSATRPTTAPDPDRAH